MAVIIIIVSFFSNSDIINSKWQIVTLLSSFVKYLHRAASENFRSACFLGQCLGLGLGLDTTKGWNLQNYNENSRVWGHLNIISLGLNLTIIIFSSFRTYKIQNIGQQRWSSWQPGGIDLRVYQQQKKAELCFPVHINEWSLTKR